MIYKLLKAGTNKIAYYIYSLLSAFPSLKNRIYTYSKIGYKVLFPTPQDYFFRDFSIGRYKDSQVALMQASGWGVNTPPLSLASLSSYLRRHNFRVMPIDINIYMYQRNKGKYKEGWRVDTGYFWTNPSMVETFISDNKSILNRYVETIILSGAKVVGFTIYNSSYLMSCYLAKEIKSRAKDRVIIFGGPHASEFMAGKSILIDNPDVDFVVEGEGEETLLEIVQKVFSTNEITGCAGTCYRLNGKIIVGPKREVIENLDALPFPDFSDFYFSQYKYPFMIAISSSRGCINRCIYCDERPFWGRYRARTGESMFEEVKYQLRRHPGISFFDFHDSLVNGNIEALEKFCNLLIEKNIRIQWVGQAIIRKEMKYELFMKLKNSGCVNLAYGLETASASLLEKIGKIFSKGVNVDQMLTDSQKAELNCGINFMFGLPGETDEDAEQNIDFVKRNAKKVGAVNPCPTFCSFCPGTLAYENPGKYGIDLSNGPYYWESIDGSNNFLKRLERFERFVAAVHKLGMPSVYSFSKLANRNEVIATYYFAIGDYEKAIPYYEDALKYESRNQDNIDRLYICYRHSRENTEIQFGRQSKSL